MEACGNLACALQTWCPLDLSQGEDAPGARVLRGLLVKGRVPLPSVLLLLGLAPGSARTASQVPGLRPRGCSLARADLLNLGPRGAAGASGHPSSLKGCGCPHPPQSLLAAVSRLRSIPRHLCSRQSFFLTHIFLSHFILFASPVPFHCTLYLGLLASDSDVKNLPAMQETRVGSLSRQDPLEKGTATHSSILSLENPTDKGAWQSTVRGVTESDATERL